MKENIRNIEIKNLKTFITEKGEKSFRALQIMEWIWRKGATSFHEMTNIPVTLRDYLDNTFVINNIKIENIQKSSDTTIKTLFRLHDDLFIEGVIIPSNDRITACISSQVGCKLKCSFCATGTIGFKRNLESGEIYDQVRLLNKLSLKHYTKKITNIVLMGMGEPLYNYENVNKAIHWITSSKGLGFAAKRITLSTIGIPIMIKKMADDNVKYNLAVSLHTAIQEKRVKIMPVAKNYPLEILMDSLRYFTKKTGNKITIEYLLLHGINDGPEDAVALLKFGSNIANKINIIEYNSVKGKDYLKSTYENTQKFMQYLLKKGLNVNLRKSRGEDIEAACGQLANKLLNS